MSDNNITKPKRTYKKRVPKTTPKVVEDPPQLAVEKNSDDVLDPVNTSDKTSVQTTHQTSVQTTHQTSVQTSDQTSVQTSDQTSVQTSVQTSDKTSVQTSDQPSVQTSDQTSKKNLPAKYEKFILYGLYLINSIQSSNNTSLNNLNNSFDIAHVFDNIHQQTLFVDSFLNQFKDIKASVKNEFKNRNNYSNDSNDSNDSTVNNIVNAANSIPLQIIIIDNVKFFITKDNKLLDFHTQRFIKHFIP